MASTTLLRAAILASLTSEAFSLGGETQSPRPKVIQLERQSVILPKSSPQGGKRKNFYSAKISVGTPAQEFHVTFDLAGGTMMLPAQSCTSPACLERRRYDKWISETAEDIQANGNLVQAKVKKTLLRRRDRGSLGLHSVDLGSGTVRGSFVRERVCVHGNGEEKTEDRCFPLAMLVADTMSDMPFALEPYDGAIGLGLNGMSVSNEFNFLAAIHQGYASAHAGFFPNSFGLHIGGADDGGEITFGGYDANRLTQPLQWAPVADPQQGRWQVSISAIRIGNKTLEACHDRACRAAIDYSASLLGVPSNLAKSMETTLAHAAPPSGFGDGCQHVAIPDIHLELNNDVTLTFPAEDFVRDFGFKSADISKTSCQPLLTHLDADDSTIAQDTFVLGESTLRRYYTFFNADSLSVGFSLASGAPSKKSIAAPDTEARNKGKFRKDMENPVVVLVQVKLLRSKTVSSLGM